MPKDLNSHFANLAHRLTGRKILIVGDVMLDEYIWGKVRRISPEAPVPVVEVLRHSYVPGGAANVAVNVASMGGTAILCGVVGDDLPARCLRETLCAAGVQDKNLRTVSTRPTTQKSRVIANSQQVVRMDTEQCEALSKEEQIGFLEQVKNLLPKVDVCLVSDYAKGTVTAFLAQEIIAACRMDGKPVLVDPKNPDFSRYRGASVVTPNILETAQAAHCEILSEEDLSGAARTLLSMLDGSAVLVTRGEAGMSLFQPNLTPVHIPTVAQQVFDITGAGDTAIAVLALAVAAKMNFTDAAHLANIAAGVVVGKVGTASVTLAELLAHLDKINFVSEMDN